MDSLSTIAVAALCGTIPAIITAVLSNGLLAIFATTAWPFLLCHVMTALFAGLIFYSERKKYGNLTINSFLGAGLASALSNSILGDTFSLVLFYGNTTIPQIDNTVQGVFIATQNMPFAIYWGGTLDNLIDNVVAYLFCFCVYKGVLKFATGIVGAPKAFCTDVEFIETGVQNEAQAQPRKARPDRESPIIEIIFLIISIVNLIATGIFKTKAGTYFAGLDFSKTNREMEFRVNFGYDCMIYISIILVFLIVVMSMLKYFSQKESLLKFKMQSEIQDKISRDLHDSTLQNLGAVETFLRLGETENALFYAEQAVRDVRFLCGSLKLDLAETIPAFVEEQLSLLKQNYGIKSLFYNASDRIAEFTGDKKIEVYRIINELLSNIARHAEAHTVSVKMIDNSD